MPGIVFVLKAMTQQKIAIFRALQLGDMLCAMPAIAALHSLYTDAEFTLIGLTWAKELLNYYPYFDDFIPFPGYPGMGEQEFDTRKFVLFLQKIQQQKFDLLIQMHGKGTISNPLVATFGAKQLAGFYEEQSFRPNDKLFFPYPTDVHETNRWSQLAKNLGAETTNISMHFPIKDENRIEFAKLALKTNITGSYIVIHPGSRGKDRRYEPEKFAAIADALAKIGYQIVLTGTSDERNLAMQVVRNMHESAINLCGNTNLGELAVLLKNASLLISCDTGVVHLAVAVFAQSITIFQPSQLTQWAPKNTVLHKIVLDEEAQDTNVVLKAAVEQLQAFSSQQREHRFTQSFNYNERQQ